MSLQFVDCEQNTPEWLSARKGLATASNFHAIMASGRGGAPSETRRKYLYDLAGEILTGECAPVGYTNAHMERGHLVEPEARAWYIFHAEQEVTRVGFIINSVLRAGVSPDGLIGTEGLLEIKSRLPRLQLELLESGELPPEHKHQVQGAMWVTGRKWCEFVAYCPKLPPFKIRVPREEVYIASIAVAVRAFNAELDTLVSKFRKMEVAA